MNRETDVQVTFGSCSPRDSTRLSNVVCCQWRYTSTFPPSLQRLDYHTARFYWWWSFYLAEVFLAIAVWIGLAQRLFPVQRIKVRDTSPSGRGEQRVGSGACC